MGNPKSEICDRKSAESIPPRVHSPNHDLRGFHKPLEQHQPMIEADALEPVGGVGGSLCGLLLQDRSTVVANSQMHGQAFGALRQRVQLMNLLCGYELPCVRD